MKGLALYQLIGSLSPARKRNIKLFANLYQSKGKWKDLFDRMNASKGYDEVSIRGKEFKTAKAFSVAKKKIVDVLVDSIAHFEYGGEGNPQIEIARDLELVDYTKKLLNNSFERAHEAENLEELHKLHTIALDLAGDPIYKYEVPATVLSYSEVITEMGHQKELVAKLNTMRKGITKAPHDRSMLARNIQREVNETTPLSRRTAFLISKTLIACRILENDLGAALRLQENMVKGLREATLQSTPVELLSEHSLLITINLAVGNTLSARQHALRMGTLPTKNPREERFLNTYFINNTFSLAEKTLNLDILQQGLERFDLYKDQLDPKVQAIHLRLAAMVTFYNSDYKQSLRMLKQLERLNSKEWDSLRWFIRVVELNAILEMQDWDQFDYSLARAKRVMDEEAGDYPKAVLQFLEKYAKRVPYRLSDMDFYTCLDSLDTMSENPNVKKQMLLFDFRVWLKSKVHQTPMLEVVKSDESSRWRLVSGMMD